MKISRSLILAVLLTVTAFANAQVYEVDYKAAEKFYKDSAKQYKALKARFEKADLTLQWGEAARFYYGYSFSKEYDGYYKVDNEKLYGYLGEKNAKKAMAYLKKELKKQPFNLELLSHATLVAYMLEDEALKETYRLQYVILSSMILHSGLGTKEKPYVVICVSDEYSLLSLNLGMAKFLKQAVVGVCDYIVFEDSEGEEREVYFDVSRPLITLSESMYKKK